MKFLNENGEVVEGVALTETQVILRQEILKFVHEKACKSAYHSSHDRRYGNVSCEQIANFFVTKFSISPLPGTDLAAEIKKAEAENSPQAIPEALSSPVAPLEAASAF